MFLCVIKNVDHHLFSAGNQSIVKEESYATIQNFNQEAQLLEMHWNRIFLKAMTKNIILTF